MGLAGIRTPLGPEKQARRHGGVQRQFACLVKDDSRFDVELRTFLPRAYNFKAIADYQTGPGRITSR
jgi:uncharacterized protein (UPF0332 family)